jgi:hypothetical protein
VMSKKRHSEVMREQRSLLRSARGGRVAAVETVPFVDVLGSLVPKVLYVHTKLTFVV